MANIVFSEGTGLQDSVFGKSQAPIRCFIEKKGEAFEEKSMIPELFCVSESENWGEKFTTMTSMSGFQPVGENGAYPLDGMQEGYEKFLEHMTWKDSFALSREITDDNKVLDLTKKPSAFVTGFYRTREKFAAALYGAALAGGKQIKYLGREFSTLAADGKTLFAKDHPAKLKGGSQSNVFADAFSNSALAALESRMQDFRDDNGEVLDIAPSTIVIPNDYQLKETVFSVIGADKDPDTANNGFNYNFGRWNVIVWPYLNQYLTPGQKPWLLLDKAYNDDYAGAVWLDRTKLEVKSHVDTATDANVWQGYARFIAGFNDWRFAAAGGISGGTALI